jgi:multidrug efflux pump subunit AcrB
MARSEALLQSVRLRMRPVLMTTVSTILGMTPLVFEMAVGLERMSPLGVAAAVGLAVGTVWTLVVVPVVYTVLEDASLALRRRLGGAAA